MKPLENEGDPIDLARLLKHYKALNPSTPIFIPTKKDGGPYPSSSCLSSPTSQAWIVSNFFDDSLGSKVAMGHIGRKGGHFGHNGHPGQAEAKSSRLWKKVFWRRVVDSIEDGFQTRKKIGDKAVEEEEIHESILEALVNMMTAPKSPLQQKHAVEDLSGTINLDTTCNRSWIWGPIGNIADWNEVTTTEDVRMISGGTTGLRTWKAAIALSNYLIANPEILGIDGEVLELGAGVGLVSLVAGRLRQIMRDDGEDCVRQKKEIIATDIDEKALEQVDGNIEANGLSDLVKSYALDWRRFRGTETKTDSLLDENVPWDGGPGNGLMLGADVVYDPELASDLAHTIRILLESRRNVTLQPRCPSPETNTSATFHLDKTTSSLSASASSAPRNGNGVKSYKQRFRAALIACTVRQEATWRGFLSDCENLGLIVEHTDLQVVGRGGHDGIVGAEGWENEGEVRLVTLTLGVDI